MEMAHFCAIIWLWYQTKYYPESLWNEGWSLTCLFSQYLKLCHPLIHFNFLKQTYVFIWFSPFHPAVCLNSAYDGYVFFLLSPLNITTIINTQIISANYQCFPVKTKVDECHMLAHNCCSARHFLSICEPSESDRAGIRTLKMCWQGAGQPSLHRLHHCQFLLE